MGRVTRVGGWIRTHPIWALIILLLGGAILFKLLSPTKPTYEYIAQAVDRGEVISKVTASGKLRALNTIKVGAEVSGQVTRVYVDFNSQVRAGQVLAEIDPTRFRARVQQAQAQVALAEAGLSQAEAGSVRARTDIEIQDREYGRRRALTRQGYFSKAGLDGAASQLATARAAIKTSAAQVASARAQIAQSKAELSSAMLDLRRTVIVAPTSGVIINKLVEPGTTVAASFQTPNLFEIAADTTRMQVEASVDEADIGQVQQMQQVRFTVDSYPDQAFRATVRQIRKAATETQNVVSYLVILDVDNPEGKLLPGMTANVEIITGARENVLRAPATALRFKPRAADREKDDGKPEKQRSAGTATLYLAGSDPYKPVRREVKIGLLGEDFVEIREGLKQGDKLVLRSRSTVKKESDGSGDEEDEGGGEHPAP